MKMPTSAISFSNLSTATRKEEAVINAAARHEKRKRPKKEEGQGDQARAEADGNEE
jgi:hypothetical protein